MKISLPNSLTPLTTTRDTSRSSDQMLLPLRLLSTLLLKGRKNSFSTGSAKQSLLSTPDSMGKFFTYLVTTGISSLVLFSSIVLAQEQENNCSSANTTATNLEVCSASYLGGQDDDNGTSVEIAPDQSVVLGGKIVDNNFGVTPINLQAGSSNSSGGNGVIIRMSPEGKKILSVTRLGDTVDDLDINRTTGEIAVVGDFGFAIISSDGTQVLWSQNLGSGGGATFSTGRRVAVGQDGAIAALFNKQVTVFDAARNQIGKFTPAGKYIEDVAVDSDTQTVIVTGYTQKNGGKCSQLQVAFVRGYSYTGKIKWQDYDWTSAQAYATNSSCADTRGVRVAIGKDNLLYFAGESAGGNTIYNYDSSDLSQNAPNVTFDKYNTPYNTKSNQITYYARLNPATGEILKGQFALARLSKDQGNTIRPKAITADEDGNVYIGGISGYNIANRNALSISGQPLGPYSGGDCFLLIVSPDFNTRKIWTSWTAQGSTTNSGTIFGVTATAGTAAVVMTTPGQLVTQNPIQGELAGDNDAFYSVFPIP